jgi:hypothetical protein
MLLNKKLIVAAGALAAVTWISTPAFAQRGRGGGQGGGQGREQARQSESRQSRGGGSGERRVAPPPQGRPEASRPAPQQAVRPQQESRQELRPQQQVAPQRFGGGAQPRQGGGQPLQTRPAPVERSQTFTQAQSQRFSGNAPSRQAPSVQTQRPQPYAQQAPSRQFGGGAQPRQAVPRSSAIAPVYRNTAPAYRGGAGGSGYRAAQGYYTTRYYSQPYYVVHPYVARRPVFVQPYYAFRPYFSLSFGIHVGYGVSYPFSYWDPYAFYNYHLGIQPGYNYRTYYTRVGGLSFEIDPYDAEVYIDGDFVGYASDFAPEQMPLTLLAGRHRVDLASPGYQDVSFDITVVAGQVIPYQGTLPYGQ